MKHYILVHGAWEGGWAWERKRASEIRDKVAKQVSVSGKSVFGD